MKKSDFEYCQYRKEKRGRTFRCALRDNYVYWIECKHCREGEDAKNKSDGGI